MHSPQKTKENQKTGRPLLASGFDLAIYIYGTWRPVLRRTFIFDAPVRTLNSDPPLRARTDPCCRPRHPPNFEGGAPGSMAGANVFASARWGVSGSAQFSHIYICVPEAVGVRGGHFRPFDFVLPVRTLGEKLRNPPSETRKGQSGTTLVCVTGSLTFAGGRTGHWRARTDLNNALEKHIYI